MCNVTGWFAARWYRVLNIDPPKIHPAAAFIHGVTSAAITQIAYYLLDKSPYQTINEQYLKKRIVKVIIWISAIIATRVFINYLNLNYLKLTQINEKIIPLRPITLRDSFLMESVATGLYLFYSLIQQRKKG
jgi:hypothetical protein